MFSKSKKESSKTNTPEIEDLIMTDVKGSQLEITEELPEEQSSIVKLVEKISGILSPYFIVVVGLFLYENNFFFGTILIIIGIFSLLKVSYEDILEWIIQIKSFFSDNEPKS